MAILDGLRLLAALSVLLYHYMAVTTGWDGSARRYLPVGYLPASYGWLGVPLFFLISGFVICMSAWGRTVGEFAVSRISRLYPAFWVAVLATAAVRTLWPLTRSAPATRDILTNLTMMSEPLGVRYVDGVYWTLWVELRFYLLFALVVWRGLTYRRVVAFCTIWLVLSPIAEAAHLPALTLMVDPQYSAYFVAGIAFFLIFRFGHSLLLWGLVGMSFLLAQEEIWVTHVNVARSTGQHLPNWPVPVLLAACFVLIGLVACGVGARVSWRWLTVAGAVTYPLYLLHAEIGWVVIRTLRDKVAAPLLVAGLAVVMVVMAWAVHRWVERPAGRRLKTALNASLDALRRHSPAA